MRHRAFAFAVALVCLVAGGLPRVSPADAQPAGCQGPVTQRACIIGFSKELCSVRLNQGLWSIPVCSAPPVVNQCETLQGRQANFSGFLNSNPGTCGGAATCPVIGGRCDEAPSLSGQFVATVDLNAQRRTCCPGRGSWGGQWKLIDSTGTTLAGGDLQATLGVGTHRQSCSNTCGKDCERCYDGAFDPVFSTWTLGSEGFLEGTVENGPYAGCRVRASFQGDFTTQGDAAGPLPPGYNWGFCGTVDGVLECPCV